MSPVWDWVREVETVGEKDLKEVLCGRGGEKEKVGAEKQGGIGGGEKGRRKNILGVRKWGLSHPHGTKHWVTKMIVWMERARIWLPKGTVMWTLLFSLYSEVQREQAMFLKSYS